MYLYSIYLVLNLVMCPSRYRISTNKHPRTDTNKRPIPRNRCPLELPGPPPLTFINSRDTRLVSLLWGGGGGRKKPFLLLLYFQLFRLSHSRRIVSFSSSYLYLYMLAEFLFCFFICSFDFFFIPVSNNMTKKEKLTERYWYVSTILCIWQGTLNTFKRKLIPFLSQLSLLLIRTVPGN